MQAEGPEQQAYSLTFALSAKDVSTFLSALENTHPADVAEWFINLEDEDKLTALGYFDRDWAALLIEYVTGQHVEDMFRFYNEETQRAILQRLKDDDRVDVLQDIEPGFRATLIALLPAAERGTTETLLEFPEETAGGRMTTSFASVMENRTVRQAVKNLRRLHHDSETLSRIFVTNSDNQLIGEVRLRDLAFARRSTLISEIVESNVPSIAADADQEEAARMIARYDVLALPVVDASGRILGIITHDDAIEILEEESTEDIEKAAGISGEQSEDSYLNTSILTHFKRRVLWVLGLAFAGLLSGYVLLSFEGVLNSTFMLALYMPMIVAAGGNTGGQAATMVIRALSLGELKPGSLVAVMTKELSVGILVGGIIASAIMAEIFIFQPDSMEGMEISLPLFSLVVGCSLLLQVASSTLIGATLPLAAKAMKLDPAVIASPAITTIVDVSGLFIYFTFARIFLGI